MIARARWCVIALVLGAPGGAFAQAVGATPGVEAVPPALTSPGTAPRFALYHDPETGTYVRPVLGISGGLQVEFQRNEGSDANLETLRTMVAVVVFGLQGRLGNWGRFHSEFRRDPGFYGTSVWEGTISLTAMDNYLQLERWNASVAVGIVTDPASADFFSAHIADLFLSDMYSRSTLLHSGFNRGQGLVSQYRWKGLTFGVSATAGNPLSTSTSFGFGGRVGPLGTLIEFPRRSITNGNPQSGIELDVLSPSVMFEHPWFDVRAAVQFYFVNLDTEAKSDVPLDGQLYRGAVRAKLFQGKLIPFFNAAYRRNDRILQGTSSPDPTQLDPEEYRATVLSGGLDFNYSGRNGIGASWGIVNAKGGSQPRLTQQFINVATTYWITDTVSIGGRYSKLITATEGRVADGIKDKDAVYVTARLVL